MQKRVKVATELISEAQRVTGIPAPSELVDAALKAFIEKEAAEDMATRIANSPTLESILGDRMNTEPVEVVNALKAAYETAVKGDTARDAGIEELRQFDAGTHPAQHSQAAYDIWSLTKIQAALNDPRPPIDAEVIIKRIIARRKSRLSGGDEDTTIEADDHSSTTVDVNIELLNEADRYVSVESDSELVNVVLRVLIDKE